MTLFEIILIGLSLAMDAFALTIANCTIYKDTLSKPKLWSMPTFFGVFQFIMPVIGFYIGSLFADLLEGIAGFLTFAVFLILALKIVMDNLKDIRESKSEIKVDDKKTQSLNLSYGILAIQAIATSIDALIIGVTFALKLDKNIFFASFLIGAVTFLTVSVALFIGKTLGKALGKYANWVGATILFALSVKELISAII